MSGINKRTVYLDHRAGYYRPMDWAVVQTDLGPMFEPFNMFERHVQNVNVQGYDPTDFTVMVNDIQLVDGRRSKQIFGDTVHGGAMWPRVGV